MTHLREVHGSPHVLWSQLLVKAAFLPTLPLLQNVATCAYCHDNNL